MNEIYENINLEMKKCFEIFQKNINRINTDRVSTNLVKDIKVNYKEINKSIEELSNISIKDYNTIVITVFEKKMLLPIKNALIKSKLDLNYNIKNKNLIVKLPILTEERRLNLVKIVKNEAESSKILIRNTRRNANNKIKKLLKNKDISIDQEKRLQKEVQRLTDTWISKVDDNLHKKEKQLINM